jgi:hypothetical protein
MVKGVLLVESYPETPEALDLYNQWYTNTHLPEIVALDGFVSARRLEPIDRDGPFVAIYEIEGDDLDTVRRRLNDAVETGKLTMPIGLQRDPQPTVRWLEEFAAYGT